MVLRFATKVAAYGGRSLRQHRHRCHITRKQEALCLASSPPLSFFSSFSKEPVTTKVSPIVAHGPFGSGGTVVGFSKHENVRKAFEENFARRLELGSQLVVYEKGEKIIDLYGCAPELESSNGGKGYDGDTIQCIFSSGKNMEAIAMAILVDRGFVSYDDLVTKHWPEFGENGKDTITVADVMRHSGGVPFVVEKGSKNYPNDTTTITPEDVFAVDPLERLICEAQRFPPSSTPTIAYHALTRGWIVNGILRRVDPTGRSLGRFLREEITDPLSEAIDDDDGGAVTFFCGIPLEEQRHHAFANVSVGPLLYRGFAEILPALVGLGENVTAEYIKCFLRRDVRRKVVSWFDVPPLSFEYLDSPEGRSMEFSSAGMMANARSVALVNAAAVAGDGSWRGIDLISPEGVSGSLGGVVVGIDHSLDISLAFSRGGYGSFKDFVKGGGDRSRRTHMVHPDDEVAYGNFVGWFGLNGSQALVDREKGISLAYCPNAMTLSLMGGARSRRILLEFQKAMN